MQHRCVRDLMTREVVRAGRDTAFKEIAKLLAQYGITAVPVVDDGDRPVGVVSEADVLRREADAITAEGLMTSPAVVARPQWTVVEAARVMESHHVKRLPVVDDAGRLIGVVSRSDLLRVFLRQDSAIREEIQGDVLTRTLGLAPHSVTVHVVDGRVTLNGTVGQASLTPVLERLCRGVDGVVDVRSHLGHKLNA
ncbi:CBS domain-containing protein [Actinacidiphila soli]|uniref:CBS domain-containing protein n=1 Tax=Actinacidiphila soli TaxID=2487275 RepID=UPI000FCC4B95|nr:CBS domain-containing protein [Actinacidiphila soli]